MLRRLFHSFISLIITLLVCGFLAASMVRYAPGYAIDERLSDPHLSAASRAAIQNSYAAESSLPAYYAGYLAAIFHGDLGISHEFDRPVMDLVRERFAPTAHAVLLSLLFAWTLGLGLALFTTHWRNRTLDLSVSVLAALFLSLPPAVIAILLLLWRQPSTLAIGFVLFPKVFRYARNLLAEAAVKPHILTAHAKGVSPLHILGVHMLPGILPQLAALAGATLSVAMTASIPIEAICDVPGLGQLAWQAALARDLPLLLGLTLLIAFVTVTVNSLAGMFRTQPVLVRAT